ncbi:MAG TPA: M12 family metallo-peptidase [Pyrinomonadaceae bacterium]|nr:M12 family metallo-peptidase [Pyrinomonadaceae bacterium]
MNRYRVPTYALALLLVGALAALLYVSPAASAQNKRLEREELQRVLRDFDLLDLDTAEAARRVRHDGRLTLDTSEGRLELSLTPNDMRAPNYRAEAMTDAGPVALESGPVRTFKGKVAGAKSSEVRLTIDERTLEGLVVVNGEKHFIEPASKYSSAAAAATSADGGRSFVFYSEADVIKTDIGECGLTMAEEVGQQAARIGPGSAAAVKGGGEELFAPFHEVEIATDADFEYFTATNSDANAVNQEIQTILNQVEGIYEPQIGLTFRITFQNVWTTSSDPYTSTASQTVLNEMRIHWDNSRAGVQRDVAHLWTGKEFDGTTIGIAFRPGIECNDLGLAYGVSQRLITLREKYLVAAHEIGHNFNAEHTNTVTGCENTIMHPSLGGATQENFCQFSRDQITNHAVNNTACLTALTNGCSYSLSATVLPFPAAGGSATVNVTAGGGCNWGVAEGVSWITVNSAASGTGSGSFTFAVAANTGAPRVAKINVAGRILTVTQGGSANCGSTPITAGQTINGTLSESDCRSGLSDRENAFIDFYTFGATAGQQVQIAMSSTGTPVLDTYLYLFGPDGTIVAENDDIVLGSQTNSRIPVNGMLTLPVSGTYTIGATSFDENATGSYSLTLTGNVTPPNSNFVFSSANYAVTESASASVNVTVNRTGDAGTAATVNYATSDGSASERSDYLTALGTLRFAAGETAKTFTVFVTDDRFQEGAETINLTLSGPVGGNLGSPATAVLTITSDDAVSGFSPVREQNFDAQFFVRQHYRDFLNRDADAAGLAFWSGQITECGTNAGCLDLRKVNVSAAFFLSIEFQETGFLVYRTHQAAFNTRENLGFRDFMRDTQDVGRGVAIGQPGADALLEANKQAFFNDFVARPAFLGVYPLSMSNDQFVNTLNANTGNALTQAQRDDLVNRLNAGQISRAQALRAVVENQAFLNNEKSRGFVYMQYVGYMRRQPDAAGFNFWLGKLNEFGGDYIASQMVRSFIISGEYIDRFGNP